MNDLTNPQEPTISEVSIEDKLDKFKQTLGNECVNPPIQLFNLSQLTVVVMLIVIIMTISPANYWSGFEIELPSLFAMILLSLIWLSSFGKGLKQLLTQKAKQQRNSKKCKEFIDELGSSIKGKMADLAAAHIVALAAKQKNLEDARDIQQKEHAEALAACKAEHTQALAALQSEHQEQLVGMANELTLLAEKNSKFTKQYSDRGLKLASLEEQVALSQGIRQRIGHDGNRLFNMVKRLLQDLGDEFVELYNYSDKQTASQKVVDIQKQINYANDGLGTLELIITLASQDDMETYLRGRNDDEAEGFDVCETFSDTVTEVIKELTAFTEAPETSGKDAYYQRWAGVPTPDIGENSWQQINKGSIYLTPTFNLRINGQHWYTADKHAFILMLENLLKNAFHHTAKRGDEPTRCELVLDVLPQEQQQFKIYTYNRVSSEEKLQATERRLALHADNVADMLSILLCDSSDKYIDLVKTEIEKTQLAADPEIIKVLSDAVKHHEPSKRTRKGYGLKIITAIAKAFNGEVIIEPVRPYEIDIRLSIRTDDGNERQKQIQIRPAELTSLRDFVVLIKQQGEYRESNSVILSNTDGEPLNISSINVFLNGSDERATAQHMSRTDEQGDIYIVDPNNVYNPHWVICIEPSTGTLRVLTTNIRGVKVGVLLPMTVSGQPRD